MDKLFIILILALLYIVYYKRKLTLIDKETLEQNEKIREENKKINPGPKSGILFVQVRPLW